MFFRVFLSQCWIIITAFLAKVANCKIMKSKPNAFLRKRVGDYELGETLGEGTWGKVRRAVNVKTSQEFAIKCLEKQQIEQQNMGKQLKREIAIMRMIKDPRIVQFYEVLASKSKIYLVLELVTGGGSFLSVFVTFR